MATTDQITALRLLIAEAGETTYTDEVLGDRIDAANGDLNLVAMEVWTEKASKFSTLVDITEGGSSRKNSQLASNALTMAAHFRGIVEDGTPGVRGTRIKKLTR